MKGPFEEVPLNYFLGFCEVLVLINAGFELLNMILRFGKKDQFYYWNDIEILSITCMISTGCLTSSIYFIY